MSGQGGKPRPSSARSASLVGTVSPRRTRSSSSDSVRTSDGRRSILTDNTDIDVPGRKSWYKRIKNSIDKMDIMDNIVAADENFDIENVFQANSGPSQLRKLHINSMSDSSASESLASIQIPQRKLFTHRETQHLEKEINKKTTQEQVENDSCNESLGSIQIHQRNLFTHKQTKQADAKIIIKPVSFRKDMSEKTIYLPNKELFKKDKEIQQNKAFPVSINATINKKTTQEQVENDSCNESLESIQIHQRNLFTHKQTKQADAKIIIKPVSFRKDMSEKTIYLPNKELFKKDKEIQQNKAFSVSINATINKKTTQEQVENDSCNESLESIQIHQRNLFTHKQTKQADAKIIIKPLSLQKDMTEKTIYLPEKDLFKKNKEMQQNKAFPVSINATRNTTKNNKVDSSIAVDTGVLKKNLFGIRKAKEPAALPVSLMSDTDDDTIELQERLAALKKNPQIINPSRRQSAGSRSRKRTLSNASFCSELIEMENWKGLPSSTVIGEDFIASTPLKRICRDKIQDDITEDNLDLVDPVNEENFVTEVKDTTAKELHMGTSKVEHKNSSKVQKKDHSKIKDKSYSKLEQVDVSQEKLTNTLKIQKRNQSDKLDQKDDSKIKHKHTSNLQDGDNSKLLDGNGDSKAETKNMSNMQLINQSKSEEKDKSKEQGNMFKEINEDVGSEISKDHTDQVIEEPAEEVNMAEVSENISYKSNETSNDGYDQVEATETNTNDIEVDKSVIRSEAESDYYQQEKSNNKSVIEDHNQKIENTNMHEIRDQVQINPTQNSEANNNKEQLQKEDVEMNVVEMENVRLVAGEAHAIKENALDIKLVHLNYKDNQQESDDLDNEPKLEQNANQEGEIMSDHHDDENYGTKVKQTYSKEQQNTSDNNDDEHNESEVENESLEDQNNSNHEDVDENNESEVEQNESQEENNISDRHDDENYEAEVKPNDTQEHQNTSDNDDDENNESEVDNEILEYQNHSNHDDDNENNESEVEQNESQEEQNISDRHDDENYGTEVKPNDSHAHQYTSDNDDDKHNESEVENESQEDQNDSNYDDDNTESEVEQNLSQEEQNVSDHHNDDGNNKTEVEHNDSLDDQNISDHNDHDDSGNYETEVEHNDSQEDQNISQHNDDDDNGNDENYVEEDMAHEQPYESELGDEQNDSEDRMDTAEDDPAENLSDDDNFQVLSFKNRHDDTSSKSQSERPDRTIDVNKNMSVDNLEIDPGRRCDVEHSNRCSAEFSKNLSDRARSSTESSGWNSHTTAYFQRAEQTMNARKSLRTLVLDKNTKVRPSTKEIENSVDDDEHNFTIPPTPTQVLNYSSTLNESVTDKSKNRTQTKITTYLRKIAQDNLEFRQKIQKPFKKSMKNPISDPNFQQTYFQYSNQPKQTTPHEIVKTKKLRKNTSQNKNVLNVVLNGKVSKPPKETWISADLYKFLHAKIQPRTDIRRSAEMFVRLLFEMYKLILKRTTDVRSAINVLKKKMAVMGLVDTHIDFYTFVEKFMPNEFRLKVIPDIINNLPVPADIYAQIIPPNNINHS